MGHEINGGDDDGNQAQVDASWVSRNSRESRSQSQATPLLNEGE